jgi:hypothetical protein
VRNDKAGVLAERKLPFEFVLGGSIIKFEHFLEVGGAVPVSNRI